MKILEAVGYITVLIILIAILMNILTSFTLSQTNESEYLDYLPYSRNLTRITVGFEDVYPIGLGKSFEVLNYTNSPFVLDETKKQLSFREAVIEALSKNVTVLKPEQYFYAADLAGFLKLSRGNYTDYYIINPEEPFILSLENLRPAQVNVTYPPSAEIKVKHKGTGKFTVTFYGYHGEKKVWVKAVCSGSGSRHFTASLTKKKWSWGKKLNVALDVDTSNCAGVTKYYCKFYVSDKLVLDLDKQYTIQRKFLSGYLNYYYEAACYYTVCDDESCWTECNPCKPIEKYKWKSKKVPDWAKVKLVFKPNPAAEEYLLRMYAEGIVSATRNITEKTLITIRDKGQWELYFGELSDEEARTLLKYFYLVQIPLNIVPKENVSTTRLEALYSKSANHSVVSSLYTLFENATFVNTTRQEIKVESLFGKFGKKNTNVSLVLIGQKQGFSVDYLKTDCGDVVVAELAYYRQPALQNYQQYIHIPDEIVMRKGYSAGYGVVYTTKSKRCIVKQ